MRGTIMDYPLTLPTILEHAGRLHGSQEIVSRKPNKSLHRYRFSEFYNRTKNLAEALINAGLKPGEDSGAATIYRLKSIRTWPPHDFVVAISF